MTSAESIQSRPLLMQGFFLIIIPLSYIWISLPGLSGGFILDDFPNLQGLEQVRSLQNLWIYTLSGVSSQLGRPISLLSFALQAENWPHNPRPFKLAGLYIHIANAWLLYVCCYQIGQIKKWPQRRSLIFAGSIFLLWLFHPLNISTVFYVVQRMTLLSAFFSLIGIYSFLWAVKNHATLPRLSLMIATLGIGITYSLGILSKENALLTGLCISVLYVFLLRDQCAQKLWDRWMVIFALSPSLIIFIYLCINLSQYTQPDIIPTQHLLTELVILQDYLDKIFFPTPKKLNIFNDGFPIYRDAFESFTGLQAILFWISLICLALLLRNRAKFFAFGVFWFLAGHLLESSIFGLEFYFEHRNYLPSAGIVIGLVGTTVELYVKAETVSASVKKVSNIALPAMLIVIAISYILVYGAEISTWRTPGSLAVSALTERPNSLRAHQEASAYYANTGDFASSTILIQTIEKKWPGYPGTFSQLVMLQCLDNKVSLPKIEVLKQRLHTGMFDRGTVEAWHQILEFKKTGQCANLTWNQYRAFIGLLIENKNFGSQKDDFVVLIALSFNAEGQFIEAASALDRIPEESTDLDFLILKAKFYAMANKKKDSLEILARAKNKFASNRKVWLPRKENINALEKQIENSL